MHACARSRAIEVNAVIYGKLLVVFVDIIFRGELQCHRGCKLIKQLLRFSLLIFISLQFWTNAPHSAGFVYFMTVPAFALTSNQSHCNLRQSKVPQLCEGRRPPCQLLHWNMKRGQSQLGQYSRATGLLPWRERS